MTEWLMSRRKKLLEEDENLDRWMVSYADFITLLFAFFVVMYAVSNINQAKFEEVTESLVHAFNTEPRSLKPIQVGEISRDNKDDVIETPKKADAGNTDISDNNLSIMADKMEAEMMQLINEDQITVRRSDQWLEVEINSGILFPSGSIQLVESSRPVLRKIARILAPHANPVNVEGFTDNVPISTVTFPSNWELSASRAATVVHLFSKQGVEPSRMSAIGYGEFRPVASNSTAQGRRKNRRVVIAVLAGNIKANKPQLKQSQDSQTERTQNKAPEKSRDAVNTIVF